MIVYHGGIVEIKKPQIVENDKGRDFGFAFYTTNIKKQAERWATRKANLNSRFGNEVFRPIVSVFEYNDKNSLKIKEFKSPDLDWLNLILKCRNDIKFKHNYDIVVGKIANDNVGETVSFVINGIMRKEDAIEKLKFQKINQQIAFCTEEALKSLTFLKSYNC